MFGAAPVVRVRPVVNLGEVANQRRKVPLANTPYRTVWSRQGHVPQTRSNTVPLPFNVYATNDEVVIVAAVPGMHPENLDISYHDGTVIFSGTTGSNTEPESNTPATWFAHELLSGSFQRAISLPYEVDADNAVATWEHGLLRLTLPRAERTRPKKIAIQLGGSPEAIESGDSTE